MRSRQTFVHQLAIDAYAAQHVAARSPGIGPAFALITLCLVADHDCTGRQAQDAHLLLARKKRDWPRFVPPDRVGLMTVRNIMRAPAGDERDRLIGKWVDDVWQAWSHEHARVKELVVPLLQGG